jgi:ParB family chromosome partitioning protein
LRLLGLPESVRNALASGEITEGHARALLGARDEDTLNACFLEVVSRGLSVRQTEALVREPPTSEIALPTKRPLAAPDDPEARRIEDAFREALSTKVQLIRSAKGGRLIIHYYGDEQLQAIYDALSHVNQGRERFT